MQNAGPETFRLYLVRHAHAAWATPGVSDFDRPLDDTGRFEARDVAEQADRVFRILLEGTFVGEMDAGDEIFLGQRARAARSATCA